MMMPANFSAVNAEVVYGGAVADYLPAKWTKDNVKQFNTNVLTILSNTFVGAVVEVTLGTMFGGAWGDGADLFGDDLDAVGRAMDSMLLREDVVKMLPNGVPGAV